MADDPCCNSFGGKISITIDGKRYSARGDITLQPTTLEVTGEANHDGSAYFTSKPVLASASMSFSMPCGLKWDDEMAKCAIDVTIVEEQNNRVHLFTKARLIGRPSLNISNGEVSGLTVMSDRYSQNAR